MPYLKKDRYFIDCLKKNPFEFASLLYPVRLTRDSTVFDVGGYEGNWSKVIDNKYSPNIYIFEPVSLFAQRITEMFSHKKNIHVLSVGLSGSNKKVSLSVQEESSSAHKVPIGDAQLVEFLDIVEVIDTYNIQKIDLLKINIEGEEYELLNRLVESGYIARCTHILVQFHDFVDSATEKRVQCIEGIHATHNTSFSYPFIWELFSKK